MIPFDELSAALDAFASNPSQPMLPTVSAPPAPQPVAYAPVAAPVAEAPEPAYEPAPMYDADKSNEIDIGDVLDDDTNHS